MNIKNFESKVKKTIAQHSLLNKNDKVAVAVSGGKDSTTVLYLLNKWGYNAEALIIDLLIGEWSKKNLENAEKFCKEHGIRLNIANMRDLFGSSVCYIRANIQSKAKLKNCLICGVIKRWILNKKARELGATKLATGHNLDDEAENIMMNLCSGNPKLSINLGPKTGIIVDSRFVQRIKPLYFCTNDEVRKYSKAMNFPVLYEPCPCSPNAFRSDIRAGIAALEQKKPGTKKALVENFLKILPKLREAYAGTGKIKSCVKCSEPSRNSVCKTCNLIEIMRKEKVIK